MNILKKTANDYLSDTNLYEELYILSCKLYRGNVDDASDLVQHVLVVIKTKFNKYIPEKGIPFNVWAKSILKNEFINDYRRKRMIKKSIVSYDSFKDINEDNTFGDRIKGNDLNPYELMENNERLVSIDEIKNIINNSDRLTINIKKAIILKMDGDRIKDIAEKLDIKFNTAKGAIYTEIKKVPEFEKIKEIFYQHHN